jgi:hypothetical protein
MGDSCLRGCAVKMIASLDARFDVCENRINHRIINGDCENHTMNGFLVVCSGMNDIDRNHSSNAFNNINNFIKSVNHTNIILISVPYRHDVTLFTCQQHLIKSFNSKLLKLAKIFSHVSRTEVVNNRLLFTKHGLHLNESGKEYLSNQLALHIFSLLEEVGVNPITLGWYDKNLQVSVSSLTRPSHAVTLIDSQSTEQAPRCTKKLPVTRKDDFLWEI